MIKHLFILLLFAFPTLAFSQTEKAELLYQQASDLFTQKQYEKSLASALSADSIFQAAGAAEPALRTKVLIAKNYASLRNNAKVITFAEAALALLDPAGMRDSLIEADLKNTYAGSLMELRRFTECEANYRSAIAIKKKILGNDTPEIGIQISNLANLYFKKGELSKALQYGKEGIAIREAGISPNPKLVTAYINLGIIHKQLGLYSYALSYYNKAEQIISSEPEKYQEKAGPLYQSLANLYHDLGDYEKSKQFAALAILNFSNRFGPNCIQNADVYYNLALVASDLKDRTVQLENIKKALAILQVADDADIYKVADCYEQICVSYLNINPDSAIYYAQLSSNILDTLGVTDGLDRASNSSYYALAYAQKGDFNTADSIMRISVSQVAAIYGKRHILTANYLTNHANITFKSGRYADALKLYDASLAAYGYTWGCNLDTVVHANELLENLIHRNRTLVLLFNEQPTKARKTEIDARWSELLRLLDFLRRRHQGNETKLLFAYQFREAAELAIQWYTQAPHENLNMAWQFAEKTRGLVLLEAFRNANAWNIPAAGDSLHLLADALFAEKKKWYDLYSSTEDVKERANYLNKLIATQEQQEAWLQALEKSDATFYKAKYDNRISQMAETRKMLNAKQSLLEYFVGDSMIFLFVVRTDTIFVKAVPKDFPLDTWIDEFRQGLYGYYTAEKSKRTSGLHEKSLHTYLEFAPKLYEKLIAPVREFLLDQVVVVPDGILGYLPFDALLSAAPKDINNFKSYPYLLTRYQISYAYSATLLSDMRRKQHQVPPERLLLTFAPFNNNDTLMLEPKEVTLRLINPTQANKNNLRQGDLVSGAYAQITRFIEIAAQYQILLIKAHGIADNRAGDYSYLIFAKNSTQSSSDRFYAKDIYQLRINADLVMLLSCETAVGQLQRGEGIISLARAFAYAGAKSTVTTLWKVADEHTNTLIQLFYGLLMQGKTKDEALRVARLNYLKQSDVGACHPFFWAAFVPMGDMGALE